MGVLDRLVLFPTAEHLPLLEPLIFVMLLFFLPFVGLVIVSTVGSLLTQPRYPGLSRDLMETGVRNSATWLVFGLVPLATLTFLYIQLLTGAPVHMGNYLGKIFVISAVGFALLHLYKRTRHPAAGVLGFLATIGASFHFIASLTLLIYPEKWALMRGPLPFLFSIQAVIHFLAFLALGASLAGAAILMIHFQWPDRRPHARPENQALLRGIGQGAALGGTLLAGPLLLWDFYAAPIQALSPAAYQTALALLAVLLVVALLAVAMIRRGHARYGWPAFVLMVVAFGLNTHKLQLFQANAMQEQQLVLAAEVQERREQYVAEREAQYTTAQDLGLEEGGRIFRERCTACHQFDRRVVGPPYNDVLPKYEEDFDGLVGFILDPVKVDPDYPPMPDQGLRRAEARAVAAYLWKEFSGVDPTASASEAAQEDGQGERQNAGGEAGSSGGH